jgi:hypothetical protein
MNKRYFLINVLGKHGYSFMIHAAVNDEYEAINLSAENGLFNDEEDAEYAIAEEASDYDIKHFEEEDMINEL